MKTKTPLKKTTNDTSEQHAKYGPGQLNEHARAILKVWKDHREFRMQDTTFKDYEKVSTEYDGLLKEIDSRERELAKMRKDREKLAVKLGLLNARARSGISGYFGPQSPEFAQVKTSAKSHKAVRASRKPATAKSDLPPAPSAPSTPNPQP